jgi:hypothetical protein
MEWSGQELRAMRASVTVAAACDALVQSAARADALEQRLLRMQVRF